MAEFKLSLFHMVIANHHMGARYKVECGKAEEYEPVNQPQWVENVTLAYVVVANIQRWNIYSQLVRRRQCN